MSALVRPILLTIIASSLLLIGVAQAEPGLLGQYYSDYTVTDGIVDFDEADLAASRIDANIDFWNGACGFYWQPVSPVNHFGVRWTGYLRIDEAGDYGFGTVSDDGSQVYLDGDLIVDNGEEQYWDWEDCISEGSYAGLYPEGYGRPDSLTGAIYLDEGYHAIEVRFFEAGVYDGIELWWLKPGLGASDIPYYGSNCSNGGLSYNSDTNWELVPSEVLSTAVSPVPDADLASWGHLYPAMPNPFNPCTIVAFELAATETVSLHVYDLEGRLVQTLVDRDVRGAGRHEVTWFGRDAQGRSCPSGTYFYRLEAGAFIDTKPMTLLK